VSTAGLVRVCRLEEDAEGKGTRMRSVGMKGAIIAGVG
jgi:hypothetical protein